MKQEKWIGPLILLLLLSSCSTDPDDSAQVKRIDSLTLVSAGKVKLPVDSITSVTARVFDVRTENEVEIVSFLQGSSIHQYDFSKRKKISSISLDEEAEGLGRVWGFAMKNNDTIVVTSRYKISVLDSKGKVLQFFQIQRRFGEKELSDATCSFGNEDLVFLDNGIFTMTIPQVKRVNKRTDREFYRQVNNIAISWDLKKDTFNYFLGFPEKLESNLYGAFWREKGQQTYNPRDQILIYSFGAADSVYVYDKYGKLLASHIATSKLYPEIPPATENYYSDKRYRKEYSFLTPRYSSILYDKYRDLYYRIVQEPITKDEFLDNKWVVQPSVIILDKNFNIIGEINHLGKGLNVSTPFVVKEGLVFLDEFPDDEDHMELELFKIKAI